MSERYDDSVRWLTSVMPGRVESGPGVVRIHHADCKSTLWLRAADTQIPPSLSTLALYDFFDGADLFGSTFKLCSIVEPRASDQVILVDTLAGFAEDLRRSGAKLPPHATPFMIGSGQWVYFTVPTSDQIHEYDLEQAEPSGAYKTIAAIVDEWAQAMIGGA